MPLQATPTPAGNGAALPPGFVLDQAPAASSALPPGYTLDPHPASSASPPAFDPLNADERKDLNSKLSASLGAGYTPEQVVDHVISSGSPYSGRFKASLAAGFTPAQITDHLLGTAGGALEGVPILSPIVRGATHLQSGLADLATDVGLTGVGSAIRSRLDQEDLQAPTTAATLSSDLKAGHLGAAISDLPGAALEQVPQIVPALAAGALTGGLADGPLLAASLRAGTAAALSGATQGDAIARQRAINNGRSAPDAGDLAAGVLGAAGTGAIGTLGLGGVGSGLAGALKQAALRAGADGAQPELSSLAGSVGTQKGAQDASGYDMAAAALTGAVTRGALEAPSAARATVDALSPAARQAALRSQFAAMSPDAQQATATTAAAGAALRDAQAPGLNGATLSPADAARAAIVKLSGGVSKLSGSLADEGMIDDGDRGTITDALRAAQSPTYNLTSDHLDAIKALGLDPASHEALTGALRTIDRLAPTTKPQGPGPIQGAFEEASGPVAGAVVGGLGGGVPGAIAGAVLGRATRSILSPAMGGLGAKLDGLLGTTKPSLVLDAQRAAAMLDAAGQQVPDTHAGLMGAIAGSKDALTQQAILLGLSQPTPGEDIKTPLDLQQAATQAAALKAKQTDAAYTQAGKQDAADAVKARQVDAAYQGQQPDYGAAFAAMEAQQQQDAALARQRVAALTTSQVAGYQSDQAAQAAALRADAASRERSANLQEQAANRISGMLYRQAGDAREAGVTGARAIGVNSPEDVFAATGGLAGSPGAGPDMTGFSDPTGPPVRSPVPVYQRTPVVMSGAIQDGSGVPQGSRGASGSVAGPGGAPGGVPAAFDPTGPGGLSFDAMLQAARLPQWMFGLGTALENALQASGQARPVNMSSEVHQALDDLHTSGALNGDMVAALKAHSGKVVPLVYNLIRNAMLLRNGVDRRVEAAQQAQGPASAMVLPIAAE